MFQAFARPLLAAAALSLFAPLALADGVSVRNDGTLSGVARFRATASRVFDWHAEHASGASTCPSPTARCGSPIAGHRRHQHARRLQHAAAHHGAVHRRHRPGDGQQRHGLPRQPRRHADAARLRRARSASTRCCGTRATKTLVFERDELLQRAFALPARRHRRRARQRGQEDQERRLGDDFGLALGRDDRERRRLPARPARRRAARCAAPSQGRRREPVHARRASAPIWPRSGARSSIRPRHRSTS